MPPRILNSLTSTRTSSLFSISATFCPCISFLNNSHIANQIRFASQKTQQSGARTKGAKAKAKKKKVNTVFTQYDLKDAEQFTLVDAMRYIKAFEVGQNPVGIKYDLAVKIKTGKSGPTVKNRIRLPRPVKTDLRICVFAEGQPAEQARKGGAAVVGSTELFQEILNGRLDFDRCIAHKDVYAALTKAKLGKILGPKGMMPSSKFGTVVADTAKAVKDLVGKSEYRERAGVVRMSVGQLGFTVEELKNNVKAFIEAVRYDLSQIEAMEKSIYEVVLNSTHSPGFSLSGEVKKIERADKVQALADGSTETQDVVHKREEIPNVVTASDGVAVSLPTAA